MITLLRTKRGVFAALAVLLVIIVTGGGALVAQNAREKQLKSAETQALKQQAVIAENIGTVMKTEVTYIRNTLGVLAEIDQIKSGSSGACQSKLEEVRQKKLVNVGNLGRINSRGVFHCSINQALIGREGASLGSYVTDIFKDPQHKPVMSRAIVAPGAASRVVALHVPVTDKGNFAGTLGGAIYLNDLRDKYLDRIKLTKHSFVVLVDDNLDILYHPEAKLVGKKINGEEYRQYVGSDYEKLTKSINAALAGTPQSLKYTASGEERLASMKAQELIEGRKWVVLVVQPSADIAELTNDEQTRGIIFRSLLSFALITALAAAIGVFYIVTAVLNPIKRISSAAGVLGRGDLSRRVDVKGQDEIASLASSFNEMADELKDYYADLEKQVQAKTTELASKLSEIQSNNLELLNTKKAVLNILDDLGIEKEKATKETLEDEAIFASIGDGLVVTDQYGNISKVNPAAIKMLGLTAEEMIGKWFPKTVKAYDDKDKPISNERRYVNQALAMGLAVSGQANYERKDGIKFPVAITASPVLLLNNPIGAITVFRDITEQKQLEKAKDEFVSLASHQLRTPATGVKAYISMLKDGYAGKLTEKQMEFVNKVYEGNERQLQIVEDMLNVARADSGRMLMAASDFDISMLIDDIISEQKPTIDERQQTLKVTKPDSVVVTADISKIRMAVENIVSNASKYTPAKGSLSVTLQVNGETVVVSIKDSGVGIAKADIPKLFIKFNRISNSLSALVGGTGLGLYLAKKIVDLHKGKLLVESQEGKGTAFILELPIIAKSAKLETKVKGAVQ